MWWVMNATAHASAAPTTGPKLDNRRVLAAIVDLAIVVAGSLVILLAADALSSDTGDVRGALSAVILGWALYYYFALESGDGQTVGKKLMKLRVVRADGRPAGMSEIAVRTVLRVVDGIGLYIVGLIVMLATGQRRQRLGDMAAGTMIVDASAPATRPPAPVAAPIDEAPAAPEMRPFDPPPVEDEAEPVEDEPVEAEPAFQAVEPIEDEPVAEPVEDEPAFQAAEPIEAEPAFEASAPVEAEPVAEPVAEEPLPNVSTPAIEELVHDVEAARSEAVPVYRAEDEPAEDEPAEDEPAEDEPMTLKSVETVSAIDLVMGGSGTDEDDSSEQDQDPEPPAAS